MRTTTRLATAGLLAAGALGLAAATAQESARPSSPKASGRTVMDRHRDQNRPLLIFAPGAQDRRYRAQQERLKGHAAGMEERQMVLVEVLADGGGRAGDAKLPDDEARALRRKYEVEPDGFRVLLIGKDGGEKRRWREPVALDEVFRAVDAMPMRRAEVDARRGPGGGGR